MSKYGNGVGMKSMLEMEMAEIEKVLDKYKVSDEDRKIVTDAYKEVAYQWCMTNAWACAMEDILAEKIGFKELAKRVVTQDDHVMKHLEETYPWFDEDEDDEDERDEV